MKMTQIKGYIFDVLCENYAEILYRMRNTQFIENFWVTPRYISDNKLTRGKLRLWRSQEAHFGFDPRKYPDIPWNDLAGIRDILVHGYFKVNQDTAWTTTQEFPELRPKMAEY